jgi:uncharacterized protein
LIQKKILITGGTGLVGRRLTEMLVAAGHEVRLLSRRENLNAFIPRYYWNPIKNEMDASALHGVHVIIHLAGASIADHRWSHKYKQTIIESRTKGLELLAKQIEKDKLPIEQLISSSAVGYYGAKTTDRIFLEKDLPHTDFLGRVCLDWEQASQQIQNLGIKTSILRVGVVLSKQGGALKKLSGLTKLGFGSAIGSGKQWMPWIHLDDLCAMYMHLLDNGLSGVYNASSPDHKSNKDFTQELAQELNKSIWLPAVPGFMLKLFLGERAAIALEGSRVDAGKIVDSGFNFSYPLLHQALQKEAL